MRCCFVRFPVRRPDEVVSVLGKTPTGANGVI